MRRAAAVPLAMKGLAMGIFGERERERGAAKGYNFAAIEYLQVLCDRCHAAWAKVEVITSAGSVFFCQHHHKKYRHSVIAAGHQIRAVLALIIHTGRWLPRSVPGIAATAEILASGYDYGPAVGPVPGFPPAPGVPSTGRRNGSVLVSRCPVVR